MWIKYALLSGSLVFLVAGCGGAQNPLKFQHHAHIFFSGLWDGFTILVGLIAEVFGKDGYGIYAVNTNSNWYDFGYLLGAGLFFAIFPLFTGVRRRRRIY